MPGKNIFEPVVDIYYADGVPRGEARRNFENLIGKVGC